MGNRKQPFGYRMTLGEITILPEEAELVRFIFQGYSTGATLGELTKALCRQEIPYYEGRSWNKNMVSRILEDGRYVGEKGYPALIEPEQLRTAAEKRTARARPPQKTASLSLLLFFWLLSLQTVKHLLSKDHKPRHCGIPPYYFLSVLQDT